MTVLLKSWILRFTQNDGLRGWFFIVSSVFPVAQIGFTAYSTAQMAYFLAQYIPHLAE